MTAKKKHARTRPCDSCGRPLPESIGYNLCPVCWQVEKTLEAERAVNLSELADPSRSVGALLWRVADILRRSNVEDAEVLVRRLERHFH